MEAGGGTHIADLLLEEADDLPLALHHLDVEVDDSTGEAGGRAGPCTGAGGEDPCPLYSQQQG